MKSKNKSKSKSKSKDKDDDKKSKKKTSKTSNKSKDKRKRTHLIYLTQKINKNNINITDIPNNINNQFMENNSSNINSYQKIYPPIKCDGCYQGDAICFCINCGQAYCKICDDQIHMIPSNSMHQKSLLILSKIFKKVVICIVGNP